MEAFMGLRLQLDEKRRTVAVLVEINRGSRNKYVFDPAVGAIRCS